MLKRASPGLGEQEEDSKKEESWATETDQKKGEAKGPILAKKTEIIDGPTAYLVVYLAAFILDKTETITSAARTTSGRLFKQLNANRIAESTISFLQFMAVKTGEG